MFGDSVSDRRPGAGRTDTGLRPAQGQTRQIGLLSPFSPPGDPAAGKRIRWGAELGIKYVNEEMGGVLNGRPLELVVEDDAGTPADGIGRVPQTGPEG